MSIELVVGLLTAIVVLLVIGVYLLYVQIDECRRALHQYRLRDKLR